MDPGDMPDIDPAFKKAYQELTNPDYLLGTKHIIHHQRRRSLDREPANAEQDPRAPRSPAPRSAWRRTARTRCQENGGGRHRRRGPRRQGLQHQGSHRNSRIYIEESRLVSQSFIHQDKDGFKPLVKDRQGPTEGMKPPPPLYGFVRTTPETLNSRKSADRDAQDRRPIQIPYPGCLAVWAWALGRLHLGRPHPGRGGEPPSGTGRGRRPRTACTAHSGAKPSGLGAACPVETGKHLMLTTEKQGRQGPHQTCVLRATWT